MHPKKKFMLCITTNLMQYNVGSESIVEVLYMCLCVHVAVVVVIIKESEVLFFK